jgi:hypothetical protein
MDIHIELSRAHVDCILSHSPPGTPLRQKLGSNSTSGFTTKRPAEFFNAFDFREADARALLCIARECCPEAVQKIENGLRLAGITSF